jgi:hypothetical protein
LLSNLKVFKLIIIRHSREIRRQCRAIGNPALNKLGISPSAGKRNVVKKTILTLYFLVCGISCALADDLAMAATSAASEHTILGGVVKSFSWADPVKGIKSEIVVTDPAKKTFHILVTSTTTLWDADDKAIMPDKIAPKSHVQVIYFTTDEGVNIGKSIKIIK